MKSAFPSFSVPKKTCSNAVKDSMAESSVVSGSNMENSEKFLIMYGRIAESASGGE